MNTKFFPMGNCYKHKTSKFFSLLLTAYLTLSFINLNAEIRYVSKTGSSTPPYTSWETAADSLQKCINISQFGDTIFVANGVYKEQVVMIPGLSLIGAGSDSCIIDTRELVTSYEFISVEMQDSCIFKGFQILVYFNSEMGYAISAANGLVAQNRVKIGGVGLYSESNPNVNGNFFDNISRGVYLFNSNATIRNNIIFIADISNAQGIHIEAFFNNYYPIIDSNYIETYREGIRKSFGTRSTITNNTIILKGIGSSGIVLGSSDSGYVYNNLIYAEKAQRGIENIATQYLKLYNNYIIGNFDDQQNLSYALTIGPDNIVKNNVVTKSERGVEAWGNENLDFRYNNVWNNDINYSGFTPDTTNISVNPMVINDNPIKGDLDFHLQMFSPLIDAGDPNILDRDGSRSDIGLYGGPYGWSYTYKDLAPRSPHNVTAVIEDGLVKLTWNKNTEADFSNYRIYRDTVSNFIYDTTKIIGVTVDTVFYDHPPDKNKKQNFYYLLTAIDNQDNQSESSEEIIVMITGLTEHPPISSDGYKLLSNYPNPFNPSTIIPYRLKEGGYVKLYVYDIKGELVKILVNQWQEKGYYEILFHLNSEERQRANSYEMSVGNTFNDIATGVYIYQLMVKGENNIPVFSDMGKMILLK